MSKLDAQTKDLLHDVMQYLENVAFDQTNRGNEEGWLMKDTEALLVRVNRALMPVKKAPYHSDCPLCLRGIGHSVEQHEAALRRNQESSQGDI